MFTKRKADCIQQDQHQPLTKKSSKNLSLNNLPVEVMTHIFSFFSFRSLGEVSLVCWNWYSIASQDILWKTLCLDVGCVEKEAGQTWQALARSQAKMAIYFVKGAILMNEPKQTSSTSMSDASIFVGKPRNPADCKNENFRVTRRLVSESLTTILKIESSQEPAEAFTMDFEGFIYTMALQKNILAGFGSFKSLVDNFGLLVVNLNEKSYKLFPYTGESHLHDGGITMNKFISFWQDYTLCVLYASVNKFLINYWDFSKAPAPTAKEVLEKEDN